MQQAGNGTHGRKAEPQPNRHSSSDQGHAFANNQPDDLAVVRAQCDADSHFTRTLRDRECDDRVQPDARQEHGQHPEGRQQDSSHPGREQHQPQVLLHGIELEYGQICVDRGDLPAKDFQQDTGIARCSGHNGDELRIALGKRQIDIRPRTFAQGSHLYVLRDADDLHRRACRRASEAKLSTHHVFSVPVPTRHRGVHDRNVWRRRRVGPVEIAPTQNRDIQSIEVLATHRTVVHLDPGNSLR